MAGSPEKLLAFLEHLQKLDDDELREALPIALPIPVARVGLMQAASAVPLSPRELDEQLQAAAQFCAQMRSDGAPPIDLEADHAQS
jgi:hypothetical protein